jgi:hypothetical protein
MESLPLRAQINFRLLDYAASRNQIRDVVGPDDPRPHFCTQLIPSTSIFQILAREIARKIDGDSPDVPATSP